MSLKWKDIHRGRSDDGVLATWADREAAWQAHVADETRGLHIVTVVATPARELYPGTGTYVSGEWIRVYYQEEA